MEVILEGGPHDGHRVVDLGGRIVECFCHKRDGFYELFLTRLPVGIWVRARWRLPNGDLDRTVTRIAP